MVSKRLSGQGLVEYALIIVLISIVAVVAMAAVGDELIVNYEAIVSAFP